MHNPWPKFPKAKDTKNTSIIKKIDNEFTYYLLKPNVGGCGYTLSPCTYYEPNNVKYKKVKGYIVLYLEK